MLQNNACQTSGLRQTYLNISIFKEVSPSVILIFKMPSIAKHVSYECFVRGQTLKHCLISKFQMLDKQYFIVLQGPNRLDKLRDGR